MNESALLREYVEDASREAFTEIVSRYTNMVYSTCLRQVRDHQFAEDATQAVFLVLARKAGTMSSKIALGGWLFRTARYVCANMIRAESRRKVYEKEAADMEWPYTEEKYEWGEVMPFIDKAIHQLGENERIAVLMRFFQGRRIEEMADELGVTQSAVAMRLARATEKLRQILHREGVVVTCVSLESLLAVNAVQSAPGHLSTSAVTAAMAGKGSIAATRSSLEADQVIRMMAVTKVKTVAMAVCGIAIAGLFAGLTALKLMPSQTQPISQEQKSSLTRGLSFSEGFAGKLKGQWIFENFDSKCREGKVRGKQGWFLSLTPHVKHKRSNACLYVPIHDGIVTAEWDNFIDSFADPVTSTMTTGFFIVDEAGRLVEEPVAGRKQEFASEELIAGEWCHTKIECECYVAGGKPMTKIRLYLRGVLSYEQVCEGRPGGVQIGAYDVSLRIANLRIEEKPVKANAVPAR